MRASWDCQAYAAVDATQVIEPPPRERRAQPFGELAQTHEAGQQHVEAGSGLRLSRAVEERIERRAD